MDDEPSYHPERRSSGPLSERVTRLEEQMAASMAALRSQANRDGQLHRDIFSLIEKLDARMDVEHDERVRLAADIKGIVKDVASDVRNIATKLTILGAALIVAANIIGPIVVRYWP